MLRFKYSFFEFIAAILVLFSTIPFFLLGKTNVFFSAVAVIYLIGFFIYVIKFPVKLNKNRRKLAVVTFLLFLFIAFPFREFDSFVFVNLWLLFFITFLFLRDHTFQNILLCFVDFIWIICLGSLVIFSLKVIGLDVPRWEFTPVTSDVKKSLYYVYPGTAELIHQKYEIFGRVLFRLSGIFSEPGHFGVICASILYINPHIINNKKRNVILLAGLLSLSMGFYILLLISFFLKLKLKLKYIVYILCGILFVAFLSAVLPEEFLFRFFGNKIGNNSEVLDARTSEEFSLFFKDKILGSSKWLFGGGSLILSEFNVTSSDYRAFISKFGFLGIVFYIIWFLNIRLIISKREFFIAFCFFSIIFIHRSWLVGYLYFLYIIYSILYSYDKSIIKNKS